MTEPPHVAASAADLDLVELGGSGLVVTGSAPAVLLDPERTPVAAVDRDLAVRPLRPLAPRPDLDAPDGAVLPLGEVRDADAVAVFDALPTRTQVAAVGALPGAGPVAWVALTGRSRPADAVTAGVLLGAVRAAAAAWSARSARPAVVVALPWSLGAAGSALATPAELQDADALAAWLVGVAGAGEALVLGAGEEHRALAALEADAHGAARALFPPEVQPFHAGERPAGTVLLLTGLSGSGKSTLARAVAARLAEEGTITTLLDGDEVRQLLSAGLGFDAEGRALNIRRIGWVAGEVARAGATAIAAPIAPFAAGRAEMRRTAEQAGARFVLVHVSTPLEECERRDRKGLYAAARAGRITDFTGISSPYEEPDDADLVIDTTDVAVDDATVRIVDLLTARSPA